MLFLRSPHGTFLTKSPTFKSGIEPVWVYVYGRLNTPAVLLPVIVIVLNSLLSPVRKSDCMSSKAFFKEQGAISFFFILCYPNSFQVLLMAPLVEKLH